MLNQFPSTAEGKQFLSVFAPCGDATAILRFMESELTYSGLSYYHADDEDRKSVV